MPRNPTGPQRYRCSYKSPTYIKVKNIVESLLKTCSANYGLNQKWKQRLLEN